MLCNPDLLAASATSDDPVWKWVTNMHTTREEDIVQPNKIVTGLIRRIAAIPIH
jgi:hypothetical protein